MTQSKLILIINADDFGYNKNMDAGMIDLIKSRRINSISVIVNGKNILNAAQEIRKMMKDDQSLLQALSIGLHFNLTQGCPSGQKVAGCKLVKDMQFIGKPQIYQVLQSQDDSYDQYIREELIAQVNQFIKLFKRRPSHIDGHNHVHIIPQIAPIIAQTMLQIGIYRTRISLEALQNISLVINLKFLGYARASLQIYRQKGIIFSDVFLGLQSFGKLSAQLISKQIQKHKGKLDVSIQLMCHPGFPDPKGVPWISTPDRLTQKQQLQSKQFDQIRSSVNFIQNYYHLKSNHLINKQKIMLYYKQSQIALYQKQNVQNKISELKDKIRDNYIFYQWKVQQRISNVLQVKDLKDYIKNLSIKILIVFNDYQKILKVCNQIYESRSCFKIFDMRDIKNQEIIEQLFYAKKF